MKYVFWILAVLSIGLIAVYEQIEAFGNPAELLDYDPYVRAIEVAGMPPQIKLIREAADEYGWEVRCEGTSGHMTVLHFVPKFWAWPGSDQNFHDELAAVSTTTGSPMNKDVCDYPRDHFIGVPVNERNDIAIAFGTREELKVVRPIAAACGLKGVRLRRLTNAENEFCEADSPERLFALSVDFETDDAGGPMMCTAIMANREIAEENSNP